MSNREKIGLMGLMMVGSAFGFYHMRPSNIRYNSKMGRLHKTPSERSEMSSSKATTWPTCTRPCPCTTFSSRMTLTKLRSRNSWKWSICSSPSTSASDFRRRNTRVAWLAKYEKIAKAKNFREEMNKIEYYIKNSDDDQLEAAGGSANRSALFDGRPALPVDIQPLQQEAVRRPLRGTERQQQVPGAPEDREDDARSPRLDQGTDGVGQIAGKKERNRARKREIRLQDPRAFGPDGRLSARLIEGFHFREADQQHDHVPAFGGGRPASRRSLEG